LNGRGVREHVSRLIVQSLRGHSWALVCVMTFALSFVTDDKGAILLSAFLITSSCTCMFAVGCEGHRFDNSTALSAKGRLGVKLPMREQVVCGQESGWTSIAGPEEIILEALSESF
jgi:hypothetical protein